MKEHVENLEKLNPDLLAKLAKCHEICHTLVDSITTLDTHALGKKIDDLSARFTASEDESRQRMEKVVIQIGLL